MNEITQPMLTEPGMVTYINHSLKKCNDFKEKYNNIILNLILFISFFLILGILLLYKYKGKLSPQEIEQKNMEKKQYIFSKIRNYQDSKKQEEQQLITGLPHFDTF